MMHTTPTRKFRFRLVSPENAPVKKTAKQPVTRSRRSTAWTEDKVALAKAMVRRGDRKSDVAAYFDVNQGRIPELDEKWPWVKPAKGPLPPAGPYRIPRLLDARQTACRRMASARDGILEACAGLEKILSTDQTVDAKPLLNRLLRCAEQLDRPL